MPDASLPLIPVADLRVGHYVLLDLGWMEHPFPRNQFRLTSQRQIETIQALGLTRVRIDPARSDLEALEAPAPPGADRRPADTPAAEASISRASPNPRAQALAEQRRSLQRCERQYHEGARRYRALQEAVVRDPRAAAAEAHTLVGSLLADIDGQGESAVRLLGDVQGDRGAQHAMNVTVLALLLGCAMGLSADEQTALGLARSCTTSARCAFPTWCATKTMPSPRRSSRCTGSTLSTA